MPVQEYEQSVTINNTDIPYTLRKTSRAKRVSIAVHPGPRVVATAPFRASKKGIHRFVEEHAQWIQRATDSMQSQPLITPFGKSRTEYVRWKEQARIQITAAVERLNKHYQFSYNRISIRNQKTCWGSCSNKRNLSFNYRLLFMPQPLMDYVIVHELCHLQHLNHSQAFWRSVSEVVPNYKQLRKQLNNIQ